MKTFWIAVVESVTKRPARVRVEGRSVKFEEAPGIDFVVFRNDAEGYTGVGEVSTGMSIAKEATEKKALDLARARLAKRDISEIKAITAMLPPVMDLPLHPYELFGE